MILYLFRMDFSRYITRALPVIILVNVQSYFLRGDELSFLAPITALFFLPSSFFFFIVRIPVIWSMILGITGYLAYALLQSVIVATSFGFLSIDNVQTMPVRGYLLQTLTSAIALYVSWKFYRKGYGFTFEFDKLRFKWEKIAVLCFIITLLLGLIYLMYTKQIIFILISFIIFLAVLLYYSMRKEKKSHNIGGRALEKKV